MPGAGKRWLSWEKHGVFWAGQRGGRSRESLCVHGVGDFEAEQTHKSASEIMESRDLLKGPCGLKANGEKTRFFLHEARMSWERFVFSSYLFNVFPPAILVFYLLLFFVYTQQLFSWFWFVILPCGESSPEMSEVLRCLCSKHRWGRSVLRLWSARGSSRWHGHTLCNWANHSHACQSYSGCLTSIFCFKDLTPWVKGVRVTCFPLHVQVFRSCFCFALKVSGRCLTVSYGSGWVFVQQCPLGKRLHLMSLHAPTGMKNRWSQPPSVLPCDRGVVSACHLSEINFIYIVWG